MTAALDFVLWCQVRVSTAREAHGDRSREAGDAMADLGVAWELYAAAVRGAS